MSNRRRAAADFPVARPSGSPSYLASVQPLPGGRGDAKAESAAADIIVFVHDPAKDNVAAIGVLREVLGLTEAEASLAQALQSGISMSEHAKTRAVSITTVYTHMRRIKKKTGCSRMAELIRRLNELHVPLRLA